MDFQVSVPGPFSYLVHEHARSILAIQELQREVSSLLEFRDNVLHTLPHLHSRAQLQDRAYHSLTHDLSGGPNIPNGAPTSQARTSKSAQYRAPHHMTSSGEDVKQQRPNSSSTTSSGVATTTTNSSSSSGNSSSSSTGGKSLSEAHNSAVADSGFSTDKAGGSMGKSSSSSAGDHLSGVEENHHWMSVEPEMPLGSAEDELWHLLDVIQRKGTKLRHELEQAEIQERERTTHPPTSSTSDPLASPRPHPAYRDYWPHSLPPAGHYPPRSDVLPPPPPPPPLGVGAEAEAWAAVERLRQDRQYLVGRVSWAEGEAAASHQRLLDLHNQLMVLAGEKRRLEDQLRGMRLDPRLDQRFDPRYEQRTVDPRVEMRNDLNLQFVKTNGVNRDGPASTGGIVHSVMGGTNTVHIMSDSSSSGTTTTTTTTSTMATKPRRLPSNVTVSVSSTGDGQQQVPEDTIRGRVVRSASSVRIGNERDIVLPRVLKVPIRDRNKQNPNPDLETSTKDISNKETIKESSPSSDTKGSDRVVIERERRAPGKADGGLSMPVSLLKGGKIKVKPDKQRISAILREKDVVELQRQLLTTVMETEVLRKQVETLNEEWASKSTEFEADQRHSRDTISQLKQDNAEFKAKLEERDKIKLNYRDTGTHCVPSYKSVGVMTNDGSTDSEEEPSHTVYQSPNIKYDVVVHEENSPRPEANNNLITEGRKAPPAVEKPPRKSREGNKTASPHAWNSSTNVHSASPVPLARGKDVGDISGRDSLGRSTAASRSRLAHSARSTPTATPRSSPAPSMATGRTRATSHEGGRSTPVGRSSSSISSRFPINRRDSVKTGVSGGPSGGSHGGLNKSSSTSSSVGSGGVTSQHKDPSLLVCDETLPGQRRSISMSRTNPAIEQSFGSQGSGKSTNAVHKNTINASPHAVSSLVGNSASSSVMNHYMGRNVISNPTTTTTNTVTPLLVSSPKRTTGPLTNISSKLVTTDSSHKIQRKKLSASDLYNQNYNESNTVVPGLGSSADAWLSQLASEGSSAASSISISSTDSFYDSITTDSTDKLMQVEVAFEWNPVPQQEIRYLPPAAHMWTPATVADKRMPGGLVSATPQLISKTGKNPLWTKKIPFVNESQLENFGKTTSSGNLKKPLDDISDSQENDGVEQCSADSLEDDIRGFEAVGKMRNRLRAINGAVRVKNVDRPTVLPHTQAGDSTGDNKNEDLPIESGQEQVTGKIYSSSRDSVSSDLNARVHQILSRIAASAQ